MWKVNDDVYILFTFFMFILDTSKTITQRTFAPEDFCPGGIFGQENFPPGGFCPRKTLFAKETFVQEDVCPLEPLFRDIFVRKDTLVAKVCGLEQIADTQKSDTLVIILEKYWLAN